MTFYIVKDDEVDRLSELNDRAQMDLGIAIALFGLALPTIAQPAFCEWQHISSVGKVVAFGLGPFLVVIGLVFLLMFFAQKKKANAHLDRIKTESDSVSTRLQFSVRQSE